MQKLIVANWKSYVNSEADALALAEAYGAMALSPGVTVVACPPSLYLETVKGKLGAVKLGAQNVSFEEEGAYTGAVTASMLRDAGVEYVILGHSERRAEHETNEEVSKKVANALGAGFKVILCVGESEPIRKQGIEAALNFVSTELAASIPKDTDCSSLIVAYEPVWAISKSGEGKSETPEDAATMITAIKAFLTHSAGVAAPTVLYGGSLGAVNAAGFFGRGEIDGALVGYASTSADEFQKIVNAASSL